MTVTFDLLLKIGHNFLTVKDLVFIFGIPYSGLFWDLATELTELISADFISAVEGQREIISADQISGLSKGDLIASSPE